MEKSHLLNLINDLNGLVAAYNAELHKNTGIARHNKSAGKDKGAAANYKEAPGSNYTGPGFLSCKGFKIGNLEIDNPVLSAPLAGISDNTFRIFARAFGSALGFTEMISSFGVHYNNRATVLMSNITVHERPCGIQIFGSEPAIMLEAAQKLEDNADIIDINMGCPVPKVLKARSGGFLLTDEKLIGKIISKITPNIKKPLTIKIRLGWDTCSINAARVVKIAEESGAAAVIIHGRTVKQGFGGKADYGIIKNIKKTAVIPVIVSGDIDTPLKAKDVLEYTGCEAVMIGRAARGKQWIFQNMLSGLKFACSRAINNDAGSVTRENEIFTGAGNNPEYEDDYPGKCGAALDYFCFNPTAEFRKKFAILYLKFLMEFEGEQRAVKQFRKHLAWIFKGISNISQTRKNFFEVNTFVDVEKLLSAIR